MVVANCGAADDEPGGIKIAVLSSSLEYVSGGDVRIEVTAARGLQDKLTFWLNGETIKPPLVTDGSRMEGVISGLVIGSNLLEVRHVRGNGKGVSDAIRLTNYPLTGPMFTGPQQQPFVCRLTGWRTSMPTVLNPQYKDPRYDVVARGYGYPADVFAHVKWTHWNDLANIYGTDSLGCAPIPVDNVGVQYGLGALANGRITMAEFLCVNACVGGWKNQPDFVAWDPVADPYDGRDIMRSADCRDPAGTPAPRRAGDISAMRAAYTSGHVFTGRRLFAVDYRPALINE